MLFFTLSAFLMTHLYFGRSPTSDALRGYWVARFGRVYPLFIALLMTGLFAHLAGAKTDVYAYAMHVSTFVQNALLFGRFNVFWTISTEFQFYLLFALAWLFSHRTLRPGRTLTSLAAAALLLVFVDVYPYPSGPVFKTLHFFAAGVLAALGLRALNGQSLAGMADAILAVALVAFILSMPAIFEHLTGISHRGFWSPWLLFLCFAIVLSAAKARGPVSAALGSKLGNWLGDISFAVYLLHVPILEVIQRVFPEAAHWMKFGLAAVVTLSLAALVYRFYERPIRFWVRERFASQPTVVSA